MPFLESKSTCSGYKIAHIGLSPLISIRVKKFKEYFNFLYCEYWVVSYNIFSKYGCPFFFNGLSPVCWTHLYIIMSKLWIWIAIKYKSMWESINNSIIFIKLPFGFYWGLFYSSCCTSPQLPNHRITAYSWAEGIFSHLQDY